MYVVVKCHIYTSIHVSINYDVPGVHIWIFWKGKNMRNLQTLLSKSGKKFLKNTIWTVWNEKSADFPRCIIHFSKYIFSFRQQLVWKFDKMEYVFHWFAYIDTYTLTYIWMIFCDKLIPLSFWHPTKTGSVSQKTCTHFFIDTVLTFYEYYSIVRYKMLHSLKQYLVVEWRGNLMRNIISKLFWKHLYTCTCT